jgi:Alpha/beta hydrolase domain
LKTHRLAISLVALGMTILCAVASRAAVPLPMVQGPIPANATSHPFNSSSAQNVPLDLAGRGYVEEEYFISGNANVYEYGSSYQVRIKTAGAPYTTRILIRRPSDAKRFSGNVIVEPFNPSLNYDLPIMWGYSHDYFMRHGDVYVGLTIKAVAMRALKSFDPQRYAPLSMANPLPVAARCANPGWSTFLSFPDSEDGLAWDMLGQLGALLRSKAQQNPLKQLNVQYVYATGQSQTGAYIISYIQDFHDTARLADGRHVYDGFVVNSAGRPIPLNQCAPRLGEDDPHSIIHADVPVIQSFTQSDIAQYSMQRRSDSDRPGDLYRRYEIGGASHATVYEFDSAPSRSELTAAGVDAHGGAYRCVEPYPNDFPVEYIYSGTYANLDRWARTGQPPPSAPPVSTTTGAVGQTLFVTDEFGNVRGGVRSPYLDVPTVTYQGSSSGPECFSYFGHEIPFDGRRLRDLYPGHDSYLSRFDGAVDALLQQRWISAADAAAMKAQAAGANVP